MSIVSGSNDGRVSRQYQVSQDVRLGGAYVKGDSRRQDNRKGVQKHRVGSHNLSRKAKGIICIQWSYFWFQKILAKVNLSTAMMFAVSSIIVSIATISTIMVYTLTGHDLTPVKVCNLGL